MNGDAYSTFWSSIFLLILIGLLIGIFFVIAYRKRKKHEEEHEYDLTFLHIKLNKDNEVEIKAAENLFSSLLALKKSFFRSLFNEPFRVSFEIVSKIDGINFYVVVPDEIATYVEKQINGVYPEAEIDIINPNEVWDRGKITKVAELGFKNFFYTPIKEYEEIKTDPLNQITSAMSKLSNNEVIALQIVIRPAKESWIAVGQKYINNIKNKSSNPEKKYNIDTSYLEGIEKKIANPGFDAAIRIVSIADDLRTADAHIQGVAGSFEQFTDVTHNKFVIKSPFLLRSHYENKLVDDFIYRRLEVRDITLPILSINFVHTQPILNIVEIATIFHFPNKNILTPNIVWLQSRKSSAPTTLPSTDEGIWVGESFFRGVKTQVHIKPKDRSRHFYIVGQTGTGKSELLKYMALQDIRAGEGVAIIDPHGTDVQDLLTKIPPERIQDVIYFNAADTERPMGYNLLENDGEEEQHMIINAFIALLYKMYDPNHQGIMGPLLERSIRNVMLTAMNVDKNSTVVDVLRLLIDPQYQKRFVEKITDPLVKKYWTDEVAKTTEARKGETMGYFAAKFDRFVTEKLMRNMLGQPVSSFKIPDVMAQKKILLVDLAKGLIGEENSNFIGLLLVPKILTAALARHKMLERGEDFPNFYLYVDEFQNFATPDFATILSEARKYKLNLIVAHQFIEQLTDDIKEAIFGNVGSMCTFRVGAEDAEFLEKYYQPTFKQQDISNLPIGNAYTRLLVDGHPTPPFSMRVPWDVINTNVAKSDEVAKKIKEYSRLKYGVPKEEVEEFINQRSGLYEKPEVPPEIDLRKRIPF
ncbi:hypothetical protein A2V49_04395 [candidate division WWE3 bacterium RBG_19FT_COMBO_34_6]|uniref:Type IV secretion system coupling protein TraD DNA-binding domain-containing protein n=1 Tax=candidate division WWE3 bacterium RBG_19FT_COMBO_34_6 TaxID=1802612 RepID=A0A1F4UMJ5_UNCKA|nr:MAG: hypothetical protein A2V49_04395 [candidate division WWE3 bacterium RBG_19FT_COMBO_34_6]